MRRILAACAFVALLASWSAALAVPGVWQTYGMQPVTHAYSSSSGVETVPQWAEFMWIDVQGAGAGSQTSTSSQGASGGCASSFYQLIPANWGQQLNWTAGVGGTGNTNSTASIGGFSTVTNVSFAHAVSMFGYGGDPNAFPVQGTGGNQSNLFGSGSGAPVACGHVGSTAGGGGAFTAPGGAGQNGQVTFTYW